MAKLSYASLPALSERGLKTPLYLRENKKPNIGVVHVGPGAFFRGHQAWYTHKAMELAGGDWGVSCVSMRSPDVAQALNPQDGLYTIAVLDRETNFEIVGAVQEVLVAKEQYAQVLSRLSNSQTHFVTMTITEKGYCLNSGGQLDLLHGDIQHDLSAEHKVSAIGLLVEALSIRKQNAVKPFVAMSCDNLTDNGKKLRRALLSYAEQVDKELANWLDSYLICPCSMVDSITPATNDELKQQVSATLGIEDNWPIKRETFVQWVIEDILPENKPAWDKAGATFTSDVQGFENAKLRLLNCVHSTMAYIGVLNEIETVYDLMQQTPFVDLLEKMVKLQIIPSFVPPKELDVEQYSQDIFQRFRNPAICHLLSQIAWDGSQKIPMRILPIIEQNLKSGVPISGLCLAVAAWCVFIRKAYLANQAIVDPLADKMLSIAANCTDDPHDDIQLFMQLSEVFGSELIAQNAFTEGVSKAYTLLLPCLLGHKVDWASLSL